MDAQDGTGLMQDVPLSQDMRDLLIRLDTKVDGITNTLARMDQRADSHEQRIYKLEAETASRVRVDALEDWRIASENQLRGAAKMGVALKSAMGAIALILSVLGYQVFLAPNHAPTSVAQKG